MKISLTFLSVAFSLSSAMATISGTNTWIGATSGGNWNVEANWSCKDTAGNATTLAATIAANTVWDFTALADGAVVSDDYTGNADGSRLRLTGLIFGANQGAITLQMTSGNEACVIFDNESPAANRFIAGAGTTVNFALKHPASVMWKDNGSKLFFVGPGTWRIYRSDFKVYDDINLTNSVTFVWCDASASGSDGIYLDPIVFQDSTSTFKAEADVRVQGFQGAGTVDTNGKKISLTACSQSSASIDVNAKLIGNGTIECYGGQIATFKASSPNFTGTYRVMNAGVNLGTSTAPQAISGVGIDIADCGLLALTANATTDLLKGEGTMGGISVPSGTTLTVNDTATARRNYEARIEGVGSLVKSGDSTLVLAGVNSYSGATTVSGGTLQFGSRVASTAADADIIADYHFDDADDLGRDSSVRGANLTSVGVTGATDGVMGNAAHFTTNQASYMVSGTLGSINFPTNNDGITFSYWSRIRNKNWTSSFAQVLLYGPWNTATMLLSRQNNGSLNFTSGENAGSLSDNTSTYGDGKWHHVVLTYDGTTKTRVMYLDGEFRKSMVNKPPYDVDGLSISSTGTMKLGSDWDNYRFEGELDELRIYRRALTADEVTALNAAYASAEAGLTRINPAATLPTPVANWDFNAANATDALVDSVAGLTLSNVAGTVQNLAAEGVYGRALYFDKSTYYKLDSYPETFPTGNAAFSVSIRFRPYGQNQPTLVNWGGSAHSGSVGFKTYLGYDGNRETKVTLSGTSLNIEDVLLSQATTKFSWEHYVFAYEPVNRKLSVYRDGHSVGSVTLDKDAAVLGKDFMLGAYSDGTYIYKGDIDDLKIYDVALSPQQVRTLTRSLATGDIATAMPSAAKLSVAEGATVRISETGAAAASLTGAGTVRIDSGAGLTLAKCEGFSGSLVGAGAVALAEDYQFVTDNTSKNLPAVAFDGTVKLPTAASIKFDAMIATISVKRFVLAEAKAFTGATSFANWTSADPTQYTVTYAIETASGKKQLVATVKYHRGAVLILK